MLILRRLTAIAVMLMWIAAIFVPFVLAEDDAYGHGHAGYVHNPTWIGLCALAMLSGWLVMPLAFRLLED